MNLCVSASPRFISEPWTFRCEDEADAEFRPPGSPPLPEPEYFTTSDGYEHAYRLWRPAGPPRGVMLVLHGIQSHSGWYGYSSAKLAEAGYAVAFLDRRGSGRNWSARGDAPHTDRLIHDVVQLACVLDRAGFAGLPRVLSGISWGGKLALAVVARRPDLFRGLVLLTPGLRAHVRVNAMQRAALRLANVAGKGNRAVPIPFDDPAIFTDDPGSREFIARDPLTLRRVMVRFLNTNLDLDKAIRANVAALRIPTLLMLAGRDQIIDNAATRQLIVSCASPVKTVMVCDSARHTLEFEPDRDRWIAQHVEWVNRAVV